tara:strand:- start:442 stop:606 length:165 start_codon:yes stop_codon:yes gene_type:complete
MDDSSHSEELKELYKKREELGYELLTASTPEEVEYVKSEIYKLEYKLGKIDDDP